MKLNRLAFCGVLTLALGGGALLIAQNDGAATTAQPQAAEAPAGAELDLKKISYAFGVASAEQIKRFSQEFGWELSRQDYLSGVQAGLSDTPFEKMSEQEMQAMLTMFQQKMMMEQQKKMQKQMDEMAAAVGKEPSEKFLAENKTKEGVITTPSGLQYMVVEEGEGETPALGDQVTVDYNGTFINGQVFDSSYQRNQPFVIEELQPGGLIQGWIEGLQLTKQGGKYRFFIPADLAYGEGRPGIPAGATLIFDIDVRDVQKK